MRKPVALGLKLLKVSRGRESHMVLRKVIILLALSVFALTGCPPKPNSKERIRTGRLGNSPVSTNASGQVTSYNSNNVNTQWFGINATDGNFQNAVYLLGQSSLAGASAEEQLGFVSPTAGNSGGIFVWGSVSGTAQGQIDSASSRLHLEVFDSKYGQVRADGTTITQLALHIGSEQEGFGGVQGSVNDLYFSASFVTIRMQGYIQGTNYVGTMSFANAATNYQFVNLGQFSVPRTGFFNF